MSDSQYPLGSLHSAIPLISRAVNQVGEGLQRVVVPLVLLCFSPSFVCAGAIAEERTQAHDLGSATNPMALTVQEEIEKAATPGSNFKECPNGCPVMIVVPAGQFSMGSPDNESDRQMSESPQHPVTIATAFALSRFEVTFADWDVCVAARACRQAEDIWGRDEMPVINVSWVDAKQYTRWLSQLLGREYRLPTEAEWEYAARAGAKTRYFWGPDVGVGRANCDGCDNYWLQQTTRVGSFKPNGFGLYDVHGNVWEWVEDVWHNSYEEAPTDGSAWLAGGDPKYRVVRGGSWHNDDTLIRAAIRFPRNMNVRFDTLGFRVARTLGKP
jgi:formylglycine-generating enzyme required for sulfatase activity